MTPSSTPAGSASEAPVPSLEASIAMRKIAYEEGQRLVDDQIAELDSMRQRSVQFLAFVGSSTSFLVGSTLSAIDFNWQLRTIATVATLLSLSSVVLACVVLLALVERKPKAGKNATASGTKRRLLPSRATWNFRLDPVHLVDGWLAAQVGRQMTEDRFLSELAKHYSKMADENDAPLSRVRTCYWIFVAVTALQVTFWAALAWFSH